MPRNFAVIDVLPKNQSVVDVLPKNQSTIDILPKNTISAGQEMNRLYGLVLGVGQPIGLLLTLTYSTTGTANWPGEGNTLPRG